MHHRSLQSCDALGDVMLDVTKFVGLLSLFSCWVMCGRRNDYVRDDLDIVEIPYD